MDIAATCMHIMQVNSLSNILDIYWMYIQKTLVWKEMHPAHKDNVMQHQHGRMHTLINVFVIYWNVTSGPTHDQCLPGKEKLLFVAFVEREGANK